MTDAADPWDGSAHDLKTVAPEIAKLWHAHANEWHRLLAPNDLASIFAGTVVAVVKPVGTGYVSVVPGIDEQHFTTLPEAVVRTEEIARARETAFLAQCVIDAGLSKGWVIDIDQEPVVFIHDDGRRIEMIDQGTWLPVAADGKELHFQASAVDAENAFEPVPKPYCARVC